MFASCPGCHHSYDVSAYESGQRLRCRCGHVVTVPKEGVRQVASTLHCANCGGPLQQGRPDCPYCGAAIHVAEAKLTAYCSTCLALSREGASYCSGCGGSLELPLDRPTEAAEPCPRCKVKMRLRHLGQHQPLECPMCCGIFVAVEDLKALISEQEKRAMSPAPGAHGPAGTTATAQPVAYLPCPVCQGLMNRVNYGRSSGVIIDHCRNHGYWLDAGELEKIAQWVAAGGHLKQYQREADEAREGQRRGSSGSTANVVVPSIPADYESSVGVSFGILGFLADLFDLKR